MLVFCMWRNLVSRWWAPAPSARIIFASFINPNTPIWPAFSISIPRAPPKPPRPYGCPVFESLDELAANADAAIVATPTITHADIGCRLIELGLDVMVEKPIAHDARPAHRLVETAERHGRILQIGHLERFNPAVIALESAMTHSLCFSKFTA